MNEQTRLDAYIDAGEQQNRGDTYYCFRCRVKYIRGLYDACPVCDRYTIINLSKDSGVPKTYNHRRERQLTILEQLGVDGDA